MMILLYPVMAKPGLLPERFKMVCISAFFFLSFSITGFSQQSNALNPLPVAVAAPSTLIYWNAAPVVKGIALSWSLSNEINASHYVIERSMDGVEYTDAAMIFTGGDGNSNTKMNYSFTDKMNTAGQGIVYYRLRMVSMDGKYKRSAVQTVHFDKKYTPETK